VRIIAGKLRGRRLKSPPSLDTRPTSDRLRETLFNILAPRIEGARFLDLCAGSGAVGIEALSRGAIHTTFVDRSRSMVTLIKSNLALCHLPDTAATVVVSEADSFLQRSHKASPEPWDIIYFDPPYDSDYTTTLHLIGAHLTLLSAPGIVVVEHSQRNELADSFGALDRYRTLKQGDSRLSFFATADQ